MKRFVCVLLPILFLLSMTACAKPAEEEAPAEPTSGIPNPLVEQDSAQALSDIGYPIDAPANAKDVKYIIIDGNLAEVLFTLDGREYTYRGADESMGDIAGVYETFDEEAQNINVDGEGWYASVTVKTIEGGKRGALASWSYSPKQYTLYCGNEVDVTEFGGIAAALAEKVCPRDAAQ